MLKKLKSSIILTIKKIRNKKIVILLLFILLFFVYKISFFENDVTLVTPKTIINKHVQIYSSILSMHQVKLSEIYL